MGQRHKLGARRRARGVQHKRNVVLGSVAGRDGNRRVRKVEEPCTTARVRRDLESTDLQSFRDGSCWGRRAGLDHEHLGVKIGEVELELVFPITRIERRRRRATSDADECRSHLRPVRQNDGGPIRRRYAERVELSHRPLDLIHQVGKVAGLGVRRRDGRRIGRCAGKQIANGTHAYPRVFGHLFCRPLRAMLTRPNEM